MAWPSSPIIVQPQPIAALNAEGTPAVIVAIGPNATTTPGTGSGTTVPTSGQMWPRGNRGQ